MKNKRRTQTNNFSPETDSGYLGWLVVAVIVCAVALVVAGFTR